MNNILIAGHSDALKYAADCLRRAGCNSTHTPDDTVTHLLLPVPSLDPSGNIKGGGDLQEILSLLPEGTTVIGGNLPHLPGRPVFDLLKDPEYVAENANITAYCALSIAMEHLPITLDQCPTLVIGWGRIGKCLCRLLQPLGCAVTVAARKETDRAMAKALGFEALDLPNIAPEQFRLIFNTVPQMVLPQCAGEAVKIDLASSRGLGGSDVIWARGLPGIHTPESSGALIARQILRKEILL